MKIRSNVGDRRHYAFWYRSGRKDLKPAADAPNRDDRFAGTTTYLKTNFGASLIKKILQKWIHLKFAVLISLIFVTTDGSCSLRIYFAFSAFSCSDFYFTMY